MPHTSESFLARHLTLNNVLASLITYALASLIISFLNAPKYPTNIPWVGYGKGRLSHLFNLFAGFKHSKAWLTAGYEKYSKHGKTFVLPAILGAPAEIIIPRNQMRWMLDQPDHILSTQAAHYDVLHGEYSFVMPIILKDPYHEHVVHKHLARNNNAIIPELEDEVVRAVDNVFGKDPGAGWQKFDILQAFMDIVPSVTNRMVVGEPLCRNPEFLSNMQAFTMDVVRGFVLFAVVPKVLHPIVGFVHGLGPKWHYWKARKWSVPVIRKRIEDIKKKEARDPEYKGWKEPNDFVTWSIKTAMAEGRKEELDPRRIAIRIMPINFAAIHTTALTGHGVLMDVLSAEKSVLEALREEAERVLGEEGGRWTKGGLDRLIKMDSAIKESQRLSAIALTFVQRTVLAKNGITSPEGVHLAYGTRVSCPWTPIAMDGDIYEGADKFDAFRYSREREQYEALITEEKAKVDGLKIKQNGVVTTSDAHFAFGHGRHACPGRFFVSHELKMILTHLLLNYDIKNIEERPQTFFIGRSIVPPKVVMEVRRRKTT